MSFDAPFAPDTSFDVPFTLNAFDNTSATSHDDNAEVVSDADNWSESMDGTESEADTGTPLSRPDSPWASTYSSETDEDDFEVLRRGVLSAVYADGNLEIEGARIRE